MCGIVGSFRPGGASCELDVVALMRDRMSHRGPDGAGSWRSSDRSCALGHRRLSIIDLSDHGQPADGQRAPAPSRSIFNGEIYNHAEIRPELEALGKYQWRTDHSDTEMLLHAYEEWGLDCVHRFYGMFAFAIYDAPRSGTACSAPRARSRRHQAALRDADRGGRVALRARRFARCWPIRTSRPRWT